MRRCLRSAQPAGDLKSLDVAPEQNHKPQYMLLAGLKKWLLVLVCVLRRVRESGPQQGSGSKALMCCVRNFSQSRLTDQDTSLEGTRHVSQRVQTIMPSSRGRLDLGLCFALPTTFHCRVHMQALTWTCTVKAPIWPCSWSSVGTSCRVAEVGEAAFTENCELRTKPCCAWKGPMLPNWGQQTGTPPLQQANKEMRCLRHVA